MLPYHSRFSTAIVSLFFILVLGYAYFEARGALYGPRIILPPEAQLVHDPLITIRGKAEHITELRMNGNPVAVTEDGAFEEPHLLAVGYNRIVLEASDRYNNTSTEIIEIIYEPLKITETE